MSNYKHAPNPNKVEQRLLDDNPHLCSAMQFAQETGYCIQSIYACIRKGTLLAVKIRTGTRKGWFYLIPKSLIPAFKTRYTDRSKFDTRLTRLKNQILLEGRLP